MSLDKVRKKLQEAKTVEERRQIIEELRDRRSWLRRLYEALLSATIGVLSGEGLSGLYVLYSYVTRLYTMWISIVIVLVQGLAIPLLTCGLLLLKVSRQIRQIDDTLLDPPMLPADEKFIIAMLILGLAFTIIGTIFGLAGLGIIHL